LGNPRSLFCTIRRRRRDVFLPAVPTIFEGSVAAVSSSGPLLTNAKVRVVEGDASSTASRDPVERRRSLWDLEEAVASLEDCFDGDILAAGEE
jgi:hypothetical protein